MSYYEEKKRAINHADWLIREILYIHKEEIDINKVEAKYAGRFQCGYMKIFNRRLELAMHNDKTIKQKDDIVFVDMAKVK